MRMTRQQIDDLKRSLGLDPNLTRSITITTALVQAEVAALDEGGTPRFVNGEAVYEWTPIAIEEDTNAPA